MSNNFPFIQSIHISNLRGQKNLDITLSNDRMMHLIVTGPNGSGKTTLLREIAAYIKKGIIEKTFISEMLLKESLTYATETLKKARQENRLNENTILSSNETIKNTLSALGALHQNEIFINNKLETVSLYHEGKLLVTNLYTDRSSSIQPVDGPRKLTQEQINHPDRNVRGTFLQFLVNQEARASHLYRMRKTDEVHEIEEKINKIKNILRAIFEDKKTQIDYDIDNFGYTVNIPGRDSFRLLSDELSDGMSSAISIVSELLMRMEASGSGDYNLPGIVLIDEPELHLHVSLQKLILPLLTSVFPNIQFIVATHSPFVAGSLENAVVFDLKTHARQENTTLFPANYLTEDHFGQDQYSTYIHTMLDDYERLIASSEDSEEKQQKLEQITAHLDQINHHDSPELFARYRTLKNKMAVFDLE